MFKSFIHSRRDLPKSSKFCYLLSRLKVGFNRTDAEYEEAINLLESTYRNNKRPIEAHLHAFLDILQMLQRITAIRR